MRNEGLNMVVVDDNPVLASVLSAILSECGHNVRVASNGFDALTEIRNRVPDVLLSDLSMPGMSGYELLSVVRRRFPAIRVIAMSGSYAGRGIPPGVAADAFYPKGDSSIAQLIQMVRTIWAEETQPLRCAAPIWIGGLHRQLLLYGLARHLSRMPPALLPSRHKQRNPAAADLPTLYDGV